MQFKEIRHRKSKGPAKSLARQVPEFSSDQILDLQCIRPAFPGRIQLFANEARVVLLLLLDQRLVHVTGW